MDNIFIQLAIILGLASTLGYVVNRFNLPLLIAYLLGGLLIATFSFFDAHSSKALSFLPDVGLAFVLFLVGMELDLREVKSIGKPIILASILQIVITTIVGASLAKNFGFSPIESWYLGVGLSFSSTIVVVKLLLDKKELTSLYGKLALGILLVEDLLAVVILLGLTVSPSVFALGYQQSLPLLTFGVKVVLLFSMALLLNKFLLENVFKAVSKSQELLFLTALAWCFIYVSVAILMGFSVVIGAFLAGVALASSPYHFQIQGKIKPLRDFFITLFFVYLGTQVNFAEISKVYPMILIFTGYALLIKPVLFMLFLGSFGFRKHTIFQTAINLSQISEFSLILILVGVKFQIASGAALTTIALTGVLSIIFSSVMIHRSKRIYQYLSGLVAFFERKNIQHEMEKTLQKDGLKDHVVVIGGHRVGGEVIKLLQQEKTPHVVLDFNPDQVEALKQAGVKSLYGDMGDPEVLDFLELQNAKLIISTAQDLDDNLLLLEAIKSRHVRSPVIVRASQLDEAKVLYKAGADYVIIPEVVAGDLLTEKLKDHLHDGDYFKDRAKIEMDKLNRKTLAWE